MKKQRNLKFLIITATSVIFALLILYIIKDKFWHINNLPELNTENWNTYKSSEFNYSFRYPSNWQVYSPTPDGKHEGNLHIVSNNRRIDLTFDAIKKQDSISFAEKIKNYQYWDWENKDSKIITLNGNKTYQMTGETNGKKQRLWLIDGYNHYYEFVANLDYNSEIISKIMDSFQSN